MNHRIMVMVFADQEQEIQLGCIFLEEYYDLEQIISEVDRKFKDQYHNIDIQIWRKEASE